MDTGRRTLVLLHPFPQDASFWDAMRARLTAPVDVIAHQFPGFGGRVVDEDPDVTHVAGEVAEIIMRADGGPAVVCGLSMGGYVALSLVADHPHLVAGLVLANTRAEADGAEARAGRDAAIATIRSDGVDAFLDGLLPNLTSADADPDVVVTVRSVAEMQPAQAVIGALGALRDRPDRVDVLPRISVPTAVVQGEDDRVTPPEAIDLLVEGIPGAERHVIAGVGHLSALENPGAFAAVVESVLRRVEVPLSRG